MRDHTTMVSPSWNEGSRHRHRHRHRHTLCKVGNKNIHDLKALDGLCHHMLPPGDERSRHAGEQVVAYTAMVRLTGNLPLQSSVKLCFTTRVCLHDLRPHQAPGISLMDHVTHATYWAKLCILYLIRDLRYAE